MAQISPFSRWLTTLFPLLCGVAFAMQTAEAGRSYLFALAGASLLVSLALWREWPHARWYGVLFFGACALERLARLYVDGGAQNALAIVLFGWVGARVFYQWRPPLHATDESDRAEEERASRVPPHLVGLLAYVPNDDANTVQRLVARAIPESKAQVHRHRRGFFTIQFKTLAFALRVAPRTEKDSPQTAYADHARSAVQQALQEHRAAVGIVPLVRQSPSPAQVIESDQKIGRILAELMAPGGLALGTDQNDGWIAFEPEQLFSLRAGAGWQLLRSGTAPAAPTVSYERFAAAFAASKSGHTACGPFWIRARFAEGSREESLWIRVDALQGDSVLGRIDQRPQILQERSYDEPVEVAAGGLGAWAFLEAGSLFRGAPN